ncbi:hypothetical protein VNI00_016358 [Paramarasmius palmivorus]|uniref:DUF6533 domain-containing protein n=1 Tax=Paramarasmius palmivorus TaxID=297713 RepID=A0AAW0BDP6_9AGAR
MSAPPELLPALQHERDISYWAVIFLLPYDFILRLSLEIQYIWKSPWTLFKALYLIQRFLPFVDCFFLLIIFRFAPGLSEKQCYYGHRALMFTSTVGVALSNIVLSVRIWNFDSAFRHPRSDIQVFEMLVLPIQTHRSLTPLIVAILPIPNFRGCFIIDGDEVYTIWITWLIYDTSATVLMLIPAFWAYREGGLPNLLRVIYQDGALYFMLMLLLSTANIVIIKTLPSEFTLVLGPLQRVLHCILTSHLIIHIRQVASKNIVIESTPL